MNTPSDVSAGEPIWLTFEDVGRVHDDQLRRYGGLSGIYNENLIHGAIAAPRNLYFYQNVEDVLLLATRLCQAIAKAHGYTDGNKRTATAGMLLFLGINGFSVHVPDDTVEQPLAGLIEQLTAGGIDFYDLADALHPYTHIV
jgi:death-on-curing protein